MFLFGNKEEKKVKKAEEKQIKEYFKNNHDIVIGGIYFNDSDKKIFIPKSISESRKQQVINYDDLISYTDIFVGGNIKKHHGITRAVVGSVLAGPVGALVGAGTGGKEFTSIEQLGVMLHLPNNQTVKYMLITTETKTDSMIGKGLMDKYNELIAKLDQILKTNSSNKDNTVLSSADEIRKFKALLDDGIITKQEFEIKKRELLQ